MSNVTDDNALLLDRLNDEKARLLIPAMALLGVLMFVGIAGNSLVVFFYGCKSKTTPATCFILTLAVYDLVSCGVAMPVEIADMRHFYTFRSTAACRLLAFVNHVSVISSAFTLTAIAIDRYKRICRPFNMQFSINQAKILCIVCGGLGLLLGSPSIVLYDVERVNIENEYHVSVIGYDCTTDKSDGYEPYAWTFNGFQFVGFIVITIVLVVCYFLVGRQLYKHKKFRFYVANRSVRRTASGTTILSMTDCPTEPTVSHLPHSIPEEKEDDEEAEEEGVEVEYEGPDFDDPPDMIHESIPDLRDILTGNGLPEVASDRPSSGLYGLADLDICNSRPNSGRLNSARQTSRSSSVQTNVSARSKRSILTVRSVTIDASQNQVFDIEPRDKSGIPTWRPGSARSHSTWSNSIARPGSPSSLATFSRTSSLASTCTGCVVGFKQDIQGNDRIVHHDGSHKLRSSGSYQSALKRSGSNKSAKSLKSSIKRTLSDSMVGKKVKRSFSNSSIGRKLRRTGSNTSRTMDTDTDNIKDIRMKLLDINTIKYTTIMLIIALVFVISCLPYLCLAVWRVYAADDLVYTFSDAQLLWFQIGIRSYFLNGVINPFIYGFFNSQFRTFFYSAFCPCCKLKDNSRAGNMDPSDSQKSPRISAVGT